MKIPHDDPRLTAYALGELDGDQKTALEAELRGDAEARAEVEAIRALGGRLEAELAEEPAPLLTPDQRAALSSARPAPARRAWWTWPVVGAAAVLLLVVGVGLLVPSVREARPLESARLSERREHAARVPDTSEVVAGETFGAPESGRDPGSTELGSGPDAPAPDSWASPPAVREPTDATPPPPPPPSGPRTSPSPTMPSPADAPPSLGEASGSPATAAPVFAAPASPRAPPGGMPMGVPSSPTAPRSKPKASPGREGRDRSDGEAPVTLPRLPPESHTEGYDRIQDNPFVHVGDQDTSTFSIDVDTASYANVRRFLDAQGQLPPKDAVRIEELLNYFQYDYPAPPSGAEHPFAANVVVAACPWAPEHRLARVALKGKDLSLEGRPAANLVFLLDVSGSMNRPNKLPLLKKAMKLVVDRLEPRDRVAIVVYAGAAGLVLPSTAGEAKIVILDALDRLRAGGSTNGGAGIQLAYQVAQDNFIEGGVNRVILATDGDFNVGVSDRGSLTRLVEDRAKSGVFLTVLGFGTGNVKDGRMEELSNKGNGNYAYVDTLREARKVLVEQGLGTLVTIAKDVKVQVNFNPAKVAGWRLIGYENRLLRKQDFNDDTKDAGEIGAGHAVTALYELVPAGMEVPGARGDPNPFVGRPVPPETVNSNATLRLRLRYKAPDGDTSTLVEHDVEDQGLAFEDTDTEVQWAAAVAGFGMLLRDSPHKGQTSWALVEELAQGARGLDQGGYRAEFLQLVRLAATLAGHPPR